MHPRRNPKHLYAEAAMITQEQKQTLKTELKKLEPGLSLHYKVFALTKARLKKPFKIKINLNYKTPALQPIQKRYLSSFFVKSHQLQADPRAFKIEEPAEFEKPLIDFVITPEDIKQAEAELSKGS